METLQPKLRFPSFKGDWVTKKIDNISELTSSKRVYLSEYVENGIPFYRGKEISELKLNKKPSDILYITEKSYNEFKIKYGVPQINDILMTAVGTLGNVYKIRNNDPFYFKDGNIIWFRNITENSDFFEIILDYKNNDIQKTSIGSTQRALTMVELRKLFFNFPTLDEQTKIANFLSSVDEKINLLKEKKSLLEDYKKGIMQKIFNQEIRFKVDNGNDFEDWDKKFLGEVADFFKGKGLPKSEICIDGIYKCIHYGELFTKYDELIKDIISTTNSFEKPFLSISNDVLMPTSDVTPNGLATASCIKEDDVILGGDVLIIRQKKKVIEGVYLAFYIKHFREKVMKLVSGSTVYHLYGSDMKNLEILIPNIIEQQKISSFLTSIDEKIYLVSTQIEDTQEYKKGLLQQMFI